MAPSKAPTSWDDEESDSTPPSSPPVAAVARRGKFDDEEDEDSDVLESWDAAEDSEAEREKAKKAAEAKAKAEAAAKASHKSKSQRIEERRQENMRKKLEEEEEESGEEDEDEAEKRARLRESEKASDLKNAEDLFAGIGVSDKRSAPKPVTVQEGPGSDPNSTIDLSSLKLFNPTTASQFAALRDTLVPLMNANEKKPQYALFLQEFTKQIVRDLNSEQVKKISSGLTTISNEKMKEEKAAEKGGKKTKAAKTKATLSANRDVAHKADVTSYDDELGE